MMHKSVFKISKMDCPSEENLIRMKLSDIEGVKKLDFDLEHGILTVFHTKDIINIEKAILKVQFYWLEKKF
jgi:copper chaperone CopZ